MIPDRDYYADKNGKLTDDPTQWAFQIAVAGHFLDERVVKRYGIGDTLVSADEPTAAPVRVRKVETEPEEKELEETKEPQEPVVVAEPKTEPKIVKVDKQAMKKQAARKGEKKK